MARRRMTLRRIDPWSVLKFGAVVNACLFVIVLLGSAIVWFAIRQLGIIEQACGLATDVGFESCAVNGGNLFRYLLLLGLLWVVIQTGLFVFFAFLHNLIADLVGGIAVTMSEEGAAATTGPARTTRAAPRSDERTTGEQPVRRSGLGTPPPRPQEAGTGGAAAAGSAAGAAATGRSYGASTPSDGGSDDRSEDDGSGRTPYERRAPSAPPTSAPRRAERPSGPSTGGWPWDPEPGERAPDRGSERRSGASEAGSTGGSPEGDREDRDDDPLFGPRDR